MELPQENDTSFLGEEDMKKKEQVSNKWQINKRSIKNYLFMDLWKLKGRYRNSSSIQFHWQFFIYNSCFW